MHGRPRQAPAAATAEELAKIQQYNKHKTTAIIAYKNRVFSQSTLALTSAILALNPDLNTLYNYRKEQVIDLLLKNCFDVVKKDAIENNNNTSTENNNNNTNNTNNKVLEKRLTQAEIYAQDLALSTTSLKKNPKSYHAWYHRIWCVEHGQGSVDLKNELKLTMQFLSLDSRNFHCWNYRRYLGRIMMGLPSPYSIGNKSRAEIDHEKLIIETIHRQQQPNITEPINSLDQITIPFDFASFSNVITPESELLFTQKMVENDFSNYSAWHYRSLLLPVIIMRKFMQTPLSTTQLNTDETFETFFGVTKSKLSQSFLDTFLPLSSQINQILTQLDPTTITTLPSEQLHGVIDRFINLFIQYCVKIVEMYLIFDFSYVNIAITMSPNDQSPWLYQRWLLSMVQQLLTKFVNFDTPQNAPHKNNNNNDNNNDNNNNNQDITPTTLNTTIQQLVSTNFIPNSDNNVHYTELITNYTNNNNIIIQATPQLQHYSMLEILFHILQVIIVQNNSTDITQTNDNKTNDSINNTISSQLPTIGLFLQQLQSLSHITNDNNDNINQKYNQNIVLTVDEVVVNNQNVTVSTFLSTTMKLLTQFVPPSTSSSTSSSSTSSSLSSPYTTKISLLLQMIQIQIFTQQYNFLTNELLPMVVDQISSQRQVLLGIVILKLCINGVLLMIDSHGDNNNDNNNNNIDNKVDINSFIASKSALVDLISKDIIGNGTTNSSSSSGNNNHNNSVVAIIQLLISIDNDRQEYYKELESILCQVNDLLLK